MSKRTHWFAPDLGIDDEPLALSLFKYRQKKNRFLVPGNSKYSLHPANLIASITDDGKQMPIIDMDFPHRIIASSTPGHSHLYIDVPMSKWKWFWLMFGLYQAGVIEMGFFVWSIRRGGNFVRTAYTRKTEAETPKATYGWFFKLKEPK